MFLMLLKIIFQLMKNVITSLRKSGIILVGLTTGATAADASIPENIFGYQMTALINSNFK